MTSEDNIFSSLRTYRIRGNETTTSSLGSNNIIQNQLRDLLDEDRLQTLNGANPEAYIDSIHESLFRTSDTIFNDESPRCFLSQFIDKMPHGIVDKRITGIGATTLEIEANRHSIIVVPTRQLAKNKVSKHPNSLYVGSNYDGRGNSTSPQHIINYLQNNILNKKFIVVADSLGKLITNLLAQGIDVYNDYFLMVDEIDILQTDSNYRPKLEDVIDYYFLFNVKRRCLGSATINNFSNPLFENECRFNISNLNLRPRNILLLHTSNINLSVKAEILKYPTNKILIAYNSILQIKNVIALLDLTHEECAVLCSESSKNDIGEDFYSELTRENTLPKRINFITCTYFSGIDIEDNYHLITVSNTLKAYQVLSINKITQIYGRCRVSNGILSDTIIYKTTPTNLALREGYLNHYQNVLLKRAFKVVELHNSADYLSEGDEDLKDLFRGLKVAIKEKSIEIPFKDSPVELTRYDIEDKLVPAFLNIDYLVERKEVESIFKLSPIELKNRLIQEGHNVTLEEQNPIDATQIEIENSNLEELRNSYDRELEETIAQLREIPSEEVGSARFERLLNIEIRNSKRNKKKILEWYKGLYKYVEHDRLLDLLYEIKDQNNKAYKSLINVTMFWSLAEDHPLRINIRESFRIGEIYTSQEIYSRLEPIIKYHIHKSISLRTTVNLFNLYFKTRRSTNNGYLIEGENPFEFDSRITTINKDDNNLLMYFSIN